MNDCGVIFGNIRVDANVFGLQEEIKKLYRISDGCYCKIVARELEPKTTFFDIHVFLFCVVLNR